MGGVMMVLFATQGLLFWAALIAWGGYLSAGGNSGALRKTIAGNSLGAGLAWATLMVTQLIVVEPGNWLWMPRIGISVAAALCILVLASKAEAFSHLPAGLMGFAAVIGAYSIPIMQLDGWQRLTGPHLYNPLIQVVLSMIGGAVFGVLTSRIEVALAKE